MAESVESSLHKGSDMFLGYICTACEEHSLSIEAISYCEKCENFLCEKCLSPHSQLYGKHVVLGRDNVEKWPLLKCSVIERCSEHQDKKIACFCENHDQLCCYSCVSLHHRTCANVKLITDSCNVAKFYDADNVKEKLKEINTRLNTARIDKEDDIKELESLYQQILSKIKAAREKTISNIIARENAAIEEVQLLRDECKQSINKDAELSALLCKETSELGEAIDDMGLKDSRLLSIAKHKCFTQLKKAENLLQNLSAKQKCRFIIQSNESLEKCVMDFKKIGQTILQNPSNIKLTCIRARRYDALIEEEDDDECIVIQDICELDNGQYVIGDALNRKIKLLDRNFRIIHSKVLKGYIQCITRINFTELIIMVNENDKNIHMIYFVHVHNNKFNVVRYEHLSHLCLGMCRHDNKLYITSGTELYVYTLAGTYLKTIYENKSQDLSVARCAVSLDGKRIYLTGVYNDGLITLSNDGTPLSKFTDDPENMVMSNVHVTYNGQVLVCCLKTNNIIQLDYEGRQKLTVLATHENGLEEPRSVFYSQTANKIIVGQHCVNNKLVILDVK